MRRLRSLTAIAALLVVGLTGLAAHRGVAAEEPLLVGPATGDAPVVREVVVSLEAFGGGDVERRLRYDERAALRPLEVAEYATEPAWVVAVRLLLSEVGPDRLVGSEHGLVEAVGVLQTVRNRLDPDVSNPDGVPGLRPWPGCGVGGTFQSCANPDEYRGLAQRRARAPERSFADPELLREATDVAVAAWWLAFRADAPDVTRGATSFAHRCGGAAYGRSVSACDGSPDTPDVPGASPTTGPIAFRGPGGFDAARGFYRLTTLATLDYAPLPAGVRPTGVVGDDGDARASVETD